MYVSQDLGHAVLTNSMQLSQRDILCHAMPQHLAEISYILHNWKQADWPADFLFTTKLQPCLC